MTPEHYKRLKIDPYTYALENNLNFLEGSILKYITRRKGDKNKQLDDLNKALETLKRLIEWESNNE